MLPADVLLSVAALVALAAAAGGPPVKPATAPSATEAEARIDAFWAWWAGAGPRIAARLDAQEAGAITAEISERVNTIAPGLAWETGPGLKGARHHLALSAEGDGALRVLTERWVARAPKAGATWEFYPSRQAHASGGWKITLEDAPGVAIGVEEARVSIQRDDNRDLLHIGYHHPALARLTEGQRTRAIFLVLDNVLGEDAVERWLGAVEPSVEPIAGGKTLQELQKAIGDLARQAGKEKFSLLQGETRSGQRVVVVANLALKRLDHLFEDHHVEITFRLRHPTEAGMTTKEEGDALNALEDELVDELGAGAVLIGHETLEGRRVIHLHAAGSGPAIDKLRAWAKRHGDRKPELTIQPDPEWKVLRRW